MLCWELDPTSHMLSAHSPVSPHNMEHHMYMHSSTYYNTSRAPPNMELSILMMVTTAGLWDHAEGHHLQLCWLQLCHGPQHVLLCLWGHLPAHRGPHLLEVEAAGQCFTILHWGQVCCIHWGCKGSHLALVTHAWPQAGHQPSNFPFHWQLWSSTTGQEPHQPQQHKTHWHLTFYPWVHSKWLNCLMISHLCWQHCKYLHQASGKGQIHITTFIVRDCSCGWSGWLGCPEWGGVLKFPIDASTHNAP